MCLNIKAMMKPQSAVAYCCSSEAIISNASFHSTYLCHKNAVQTDLPGLLNSRLLFGLNILICPSPQTKRDE